MKEKNQRRKKINKYNIEKWKERHKIMGRRTNELEWGNALYKVLADDNLFYFF
jgi:hypothetical protein